MIGVIDSARVERARKRAEIEFHREQLVKWLKQESADCMVLDTDDDPTLIQRRLGRPRSSEWLEKNLIKLNPSLKFSTNWNNPTKRFLLFFPPDGSAPQTLSYENGVMPERSLFSVKTEIVPHPDVFRGKVRLERKDLPKHEYVSHEEGFVFDDTALLPGFVKVQRPWNEMKRGWRTVLLRLVEFGVLRPGEVERIFGADNTPEWQRGMGKLLTY